MIEMSKEESVRLYKQKWYQENKEYLNIKGNWWKLLNYDKMTERNRLYRLINREKIKKKDREYYYKNREKILRQKKEKRLGRIEYPTMYKTPTYYFSRYRRKGVMPGINEI